MTRAARHSAVGWAQLNRQPFAGSEEAHQALRTFTDLVHALSLHARHVAGPERISHRVRFNPSADPRLQAAARFTTALGKAAAAPRPRRFEAIREGSLPAHLRAAAVAVRTATDLLATHKGPDGRWRTPESCALDGLLARLSVLDDVAALTIRLADARPALLRSAHTGGVPVSWLQLHPVPELAAVRDTARDLHALVASLERVPAIDAAVPANPPVRTGEPLTELADRVARMRVLAWHSATYPGREVGIAMLRTFAEIAVVLHGNAALANARLSTDAMALPAAGPEIGKTLLARAETWRQIRSRLQTLDSSSWPEPSLEQDAQAVRELLAGLVTTRHHSPTGPARGMHPTTANTSQPRAETTPQQAQLTASLISAASAFEEIARWNATTMRALHAGGHIGGPNWIVTGQASRHLSGKDVSDHPELVTGNLRRALVPAPQERIGDLLTAYDAVSSAPLSLLRSPPNPALPHPQPMDVPGL